MAKQSVFAIYLEPGDKVLEMDGEDSRTNGERNFPRIEYVGDWCTDPAGEFNCRVGFVGGTHTTFAPADIVTIEK